MPYYLFSPVGGHPALSDPKAFTCSLYPIPSLTIPIVLFTSCTYTPRPPILPTPRAMPALHCPLPVSARLAHLPRLPLHVPTPPCPPLCPQPPPRSSVPQQLTSLLHLKCLPTVHTADRTLRSIHIHQLCAHLCPLTLLSASFSYPLVCLVFIPSSLPRFHTI